jgi:hypothetical protein
MKMKSLLLIAVATLGLTTATMAQVPNYVPSNGLVGWWPFNGNANDESGNSFNGVHNGPSLSSDRFGSPNSSYNFNGISDYLTIPSSVNNSITGPYSVSFWIKNNDGLNVFNGHEVIGDRDSSSFKFRFRMNFGISGSALLQDTSYIEAVVANQAYTILSSIPAVNIWEHYVISYSAINQVLSAYKNGLLINSINNVPFEPNARQINVARAVSPDYQNGVAYYNGTIDDIGYWSRTLSQQEIIELYNSVNCANNTVITPQINSLVIGSMATFTATTLDPNPAYVWQSNLGQGFQTLNNVGNYSGANTGTLNISNVQLPNHTQPIRVISTSGNCIDTSNVAVINILDTCITNVTVYDTLLTTVTDTLVINATLTGLNPPNNLNTLKVFPNPANTHITIDYGNVSLMSGYTLKIVNALGQTVFTAPINQQTSYINLSTWTGNGIYYVQLINPQNNTIENRKIVIQ